MIVLLYFRVELSLHDWQSVGWSLGQLRVAEMQTEQIHRFFNGLSAPGREQRCQIQLNVLLPRT